MIVTRRIIAATSWRPRCLFTPQASLQMFETPRRKNIIVNVLRDYWRFRKIPLPKRPSDCERIIRGENNAAITFFLTLHFTPSPKRYISLAILCARLNEIQEAGSSQGTRRVRAAVSLFTILRLRFRYKEKFRDGGRINGRQIAPTFFFLPPREPPRFLGHISRDLFAQPWVTWSKNLGAPAFFRWTKNRGSLHHENETLLSWSCAGLDQSSAFVVFSFAAMKSASSNNGVQICTRVCSIHSIRSIRFPPGFLQGPPKVNTYDRCPIVFRK